MIVTVRIAPVERWCQLFHFTAHAGLDIQIITSPVKTYQCVLDGEPVRHWEVTIDSALKVADITGDEALRRGVLARQKPWICEHMLEMD